MCRLRVAQNRTIGRVVPYPMRWRLGYHRVNTIRSKVRRGLAHSGFGGSGGFADPDRELAAALVLNSGTGPPFRDARALRITDGAPRRGAPRCRPSSRVSDPHRVV